MVRERVLVDPGNRSPEHASGTDQRLRRGNTPRTAKIPAQARLGLGSGSARARLERLGRRLGPHARWDCDLVGPENHSPLGLGSGSARPRNSGTFWRALNLLN